MQYFATFAVFASAVVAAPFATPSNTFTKRACAGPETTIYLENQDAHRSAQVTLCTDNLADDVAAVFAHTNIDSRDGHFYATAARLVSYTDGLPAYCNFQQRQRRLSWQSHQGRAQLKRLGHDRAAWFDRPRTKQDSMYGGSA